MLTFDSVNVREMIFSMQRVEYELEWSLVEWNKKYIVMWIYFNLEMYMGVAGLIRNCPGLLFLLPITLLVTTMLYMYIKHTNGAVPLKLT